MNKLNYISIFGSAILFGIGLEISQMTDPNKVIGFLNVFGKWDPSLAMVMVGAIFVNSIFYFLINKRNSSKGINQDSKLPESKLIDKRLIIGSGLFGIGWGIAGFCPGPLIANIFNFQIEILIAIISMFVGFIIHHKLVGTKS